MSPRLTRPAARFYYESHITIEPVFDRALMRVAQISAAHGFKVADLLMQKRASDTAERSKHDTFCTGRSRDFDDLCERMEWCVRHLRAVGFRVWRYKIEDTILDSKVDHDELGLLGWAISGAEYTRLDTVLERARAAVEAMTPDQLAHMRHEQRISFAAGNLKISRPDRDPAEIDRGVRAAAGLCPCGPCVAQRSS